MLSAFKTQMHTLSLNVQFRRSDPKVRFIMAQIKLLSEDLQKISIEELNEVPSRIEEDLEAFKQWIEKQPHLRARTDDQFLIQFLRGCKYSLERAKEKIDLYFSLKSKYPDFFNASDVDSPRFQGIHKLGCFTFMPKPLQETGPRLAVCQYNYDTSKHSIDDICHIFTAMHELMIYQDPYACINGLVYIVDFAKASASHYLQLNPNFCKKFISFLEKSMPFRIKHAYYINTSSAAQQFFKILFPFLSEKLKQRITIMGGNMKELADHIPPEYLPEDYGGQNSSCAEAAQEYSKTWDLYRDYLKENPKYGTDEALRPGKPLDLDGLFGVGGTFRKLNVD